MVEADRQLLELALGQLLDNAAKYSPPGSTIEITAATNGSGTDTISVRNSGPEIPEAERQRLFERFYRGTHARQIPGTGLGLAIVRRIVQAHGGTLIMESERSTGTVFRLSLPRERPS
jgi:two-component system sensor histidine kinase MprB